MMAKSSISLVSVQKPTQLTSSLKGSANGTGAGRLVSRLAWLGVFIEVLQARTCTDWSGRNSLSDRGRGIPSELFDLLDAGSPPAPNIGHTAR